MNKNIKNETSFYYGRTNDLIITYVAIGDNTYISIDRDIATNAVCGMRVFTSHDLAISDIKNRLCLKEYENPELTANAEDLLRDKIDELRTEIDILDKHYKNIFESGNKVSSASISPNYNSTTIANTTIAKVVEPSEIAIKTHNNNVVTRFMDSTVEYSEKGMISLFSLYENFIKKTSLNRIQYDDFITYIQKYISDKKYEIVSKGESKYIRYIITHIKFKKPNIADTKFASKSNTSNIKKHNEKPRISYSDIQKKLNDIIANSDSSLSKKDISEKIGMAYSTFYRALSNGLLVINEEEK